MVSRKYADKILKSSNIFTAKDDYPIGGSVLIKENKIMDVIAGDTNKNIDEYIAPHTEIYEFGDKLIMPGFVDAHLHYFVGAISASEHMCTEISESSSEENCIEILKAFDKDHPDEKKILGIGWFPANWGDGPLPSKKSLDQAFPHKPVYLIAADVHTFWMNTLALEEAGISPHMTPKSGEVGKFENGELNGLLHEPDAFAPAMAKVLDMDEDLIKGVHKNFLNQIVANGITSIGEMSADDYSQIDLKKYKILKNMEEDGELIARMHFYTRLEGYDDFKKALDLKKGYSSEKLRLGGVKGFIDGVTSTYTAYMLEPYTDKPETTGIGTPLVAREEMEKSVLAANRAGLDVRIHCIGDAAVRMALDIYEKSNRLNKDSNFKNAIEHIESIHPDDIPRFGDLGVVPSFQPEHLTLDAFEKLTRIGEERAKYEWPLRSILENGGALSFSSDYPVVDFNPFKGLYAAVYRKNPDGSDSSVNPSEAIPLADALKAYTRGAAGAYNRDDIGLLEKGKLADIAVIDRNLFDCVGKDLAEASVLMTIMDGDIVYRA